MGTSATTLLAALVLGAAQSATAAQALNPSDWKNRQPVEVPAAGLMRLAVPPETFDAARPGLEDLRLVDAAGREVPYLLVRPARETPAPFAVRSFGVTLTDRATQVTIGTDGKTPLETIVLETPAPGFLKSATVEVSADGEQWETVATGVPLFRQFGADKLDFRLGGRVAAFMRVTLDDSRSRPVPVTGARVTPVPVAATPLETQPLPVRIVRREEFSAETVLTLDLGAAHVPLAALAFATPDPLFMRSVTVTVRELRDTTAVEHTLATGAIYRVSVDGATPSVRLDVPLESAAPSRELLVHIANGDSPPLGLDEVRARYRPVWLVFNAAQAGPLTLLSGHSRVAAPRYDLARLDRDLKRAPATTVTCGPLAPNPGYAPTGPLAGLRIDGAPLDVSAWAYHKPVRIDASGVQQLELDLDVLARAQTSFADLRLLRDGRQVPYLLERPALSRPLKLTLAPAHDPKRPSWSRWEIKLPHARLPLIRLALTTTTPFFQRHLRLHEKISDDRGYSYDNTLADAEWSKPPEGPATLALNLYSTPQTDTLVLETDNGDNPPLALAPPQAAHAVVRLLFKADTGAPLDLYYGHKVVGAPRYDLAIVARQILRAEKNIATLEAGGAPSVGGARALLTGTRAGILFWGALALVVIVLLVVVARLLPKAPPPPAS